MTATVCSGSESKILRTTVVFPEPVPPAIPMISMGRECVWLRAKRQLVVVKTMFRGCAVFVSRVEKGINCAANVRKKPCASLFLLHSL